MFVVHPTVAPAASPLADSYPLASGGASGSGAPPPAVVHDEPSRPPPGAPASPPTVTIRTTWRLELVEPGLVVLPDWRPDAGHAGPKDVDVAVYGAVARKR